MRISNIRQPVGRSLAGRWRKWAALGRAFSTRGLHRDQYERQCQWVVHFYNGRSPVEQWIKEEKYALNWTRLSWKNLVSNQMRFAFFVMAYNLAGNFLRRLVLPREIRHWSLCTLPTKLIKIGAKVVRHSRYITFQMAEGVVSGKLFAEILLRIK